MRLTDSDDELYKQIVDAEYAMHPRERQNAHWVMNKDWKDRIQAMRHAQPNPRLMMQALLGRPVKITADGGEPHLVAEPQREMVPIEPGQEVVYIKCDDPACPKHKPGLHHAHMQR